MVARNSKMPLNDNAKLMQEAADGDLEAFACLYDRFAPILMHLFVRRGADLTLAEDLTQQVFLCLWQHRKTFRAQSSFETYLLSIAKHKLTKELRESRRVAEIGLKGHPQLNGGSHSWLSEPETGFYLRELAAAVRRAKAKLTDEQRNALEAFQAVDTPLDKALEELGCSYGAFKKRLKRARKRMRGLLAPFLNDENEPDKK